MKKAFLLIPALLLLALTACDGATQGGGGGPSVEPPAAYVPQDPDTALASAGAVALYVDASLYLEATAETSSLSTNSLPAFVGAISGGMGLLPEYLEETSRCQIDKTSSDGDDDGNEQTHYQIDCAVEYSPQNTIVVVKGDFYSGDPDDADSNQFYPYGYRFDHLIVEYAKLSAGTMTTLYYVLDGSVNYSPDESMVVNAPDFLINTSLLQDGNTLGKIYFYPAHPVTITDLTSSGSATRFSLHPTMGDYSTPHWDPNDTDYANITDIATPGGDPTFDLSCLPWGFASGGVKYTDANGKYVSISFGSCSAPVLETDLTQ